MYILIVVACCSHQGRTAGRRTPGKDQNRRPGDQTRATLEEWQRWCQWSRLENDLPWQSSPRKAASPTGRSGSMTTGVWSTYSARTMPIRSIVEGKLYQQFLNRSYRASQGTSSARTMPVGLRSIVEVALYQSFLVNPGRPGIWTIPVRSSVEAELYQQFLNRSFRACRGTSRAKTTIVRAIVVVAHYQSFLNQSHRRMVDLHCEDHSSTFQCRGGTLPAVPEPVVPRVSRYQWRRQNEDECWSINSGDWGVARPPVAERLLSPVEGDMNSFRMWTPTLHDELDSRIHRETTLLNC